MALPYSDNYVLVIMVPCNHSFNTDPVVGISNALANVRRCQAVSRLELSGKHAGGGRSLTDGAPLSFGSLAVICTPRQ